MGFREREDGYAVFPQARSGGGRVGEEGRSRWAPYYLKKKKKRREGRGLENMSRLITGSTCDGASVFQGSSSPVSTSARGGCLCECIGLCADRRWRLLQCR